MTATTYGSTVTYTQEYRASRSSARCCKANLDKAGDLTSVNGYAAPGLNLTVDPRFSASAAAPRDRRRRVRPGPAAEDGADTDTSGIKAASTDLIVYRIGAVKGDTGETILAYVVEVTNGQERARHGVRRRQHRQGRSTATR